MENSRRTHADASEPRRYREQADEPANPGFEPVPTGDLPLVVHVTDEPGGDPYNHTGSFKRVYR